MRRSTVLLAVTLALSACDRLSGGPRTDGPLLTALDSVRLEETDSMSIGRPIYLIGEASGAFYISDAMNGQVLQYAPDGSFIRTFGRPGRGPGEFGFPNPLALVGDSILAVGDMGNLQLTLFDRRTGSFLRSARVGQGMFWSMQALGDTLMVSRVYPGASTSLSVWWPGADTAVHGGVIPAEYEKVHPLLANHPYTRLALLGDTVMIGFSGHGDLFLMHRDGTVFDTVSVPAVKRRGVPADIAERFAARPLTDEEIVSMLSVLQGMQRLPSGEIAFYYTDGVFADGLLTGDGFVSVLSKDLKQACVDARVATSPVTAPTIAFRGDTLLSLEQHITDDARAETYLKRYRIDTSRCNWIPVGRKGT
jgi:hypothetical protein